MATKPMSLLSATTQADAALTAALETLRLLVEKKVVSTSEAEDVATNTLIMVEPKRRDNVLGVIRHFLPDYQPPRFSAFGQGLAPEFPSDEPAS